MAAQTGVSAKMCWVWAPANAESIHFRHPGDFPEDDAALKSFFLGGVKGTKIARISPVKMFQSMGTMSFIQEKGAIRQVETDFLLPWHEGLLLLDELERSRGQAGHLGATWFDYELRGILYRERQRIELSSAKYVEQRLEKMAVTGSIVYDSNAVEHNDRREGLSVDQALPDNWECIEGQPRIESIVNYLPPWEAICHDKCGFYQDFYLVRWAHPFSEIDYSAVENGCSSEKGATWEPDECLPACHADAMRVLAKRNWLNKRREQEAKEAEQRHNSLFESQTTPTKRALQDHVDASSEKRLRTDSLEVSKPTAHTKRYGMVLNRDMLCLSIGHDFQEPSEKDFSEIRNGWPKHPQDYPKGFSCAGPPGFCRENCDCMDDSRPQSQWEVTKMWLEDATRSHQAKCSIEHLSAQRNFVTRRGLVSNKCHCFETAQTMKGETNHMISAHALAGSIQSSMRSVLEAIPLSSIPRRIGHRAKACIPAIAFLADDLDLAPLRCDVLSWDGSAAPEWLHIDPASGEISASPGVSISEHLFFSLKFSHAEGCIATARVGLTPSEDQLWTTMTEVIRHHFNDTNRCLLHSGARVVLQEHLADVYDFAAGGPRDIELGEWLRVMSRVLRMLRTAAVTNLTH